MDRANRKLMTHSTQNFAEQTPTEKEDERGKLRELVRTKKRYDDQHGVSVFRTSGGRNPKMMLHSASTITIYHSWELPRKRFPRQQSTTATSIDLSCSNTVEGWAFGIWSQTYLCCDRERRKIEELFFLSSAIRSRCWRISDDESISDAHRESKLSRMCNTNQNWTFSIELHVQWYILNLPRFAFLPFFWLKSCFLFLFHAPGLPKIARIAPKAVAIQHQCFADTGFFSV